MRGSWRFRLAVVLVAALALRVGLVLATPGYVPSFDAADFAFHATILGEEGRYPPWFPGSLSASAFRPPAYPHLVAALWEITGPSVTAARMMGAALGAVVVLLTYLVAGALWGRRTAEWAGAIAAVAPPLVLMGGTLLSEVLFAPLLLGIVLAGLRHRRAPALRWAAVIGVLCGLATLTRSNGLVLLLPAALAVVGSGASLRRSALSVGVVVAAFAVTVAPWAVRNAQAFDRLAPLSTQAGFSLRGQFNAATAADGPVQAAPRSPADIPGVPEARAAGRDELATDQALRGPALRYALDHPAVVGEVLRLNALRTLETGGHPSFTNSWDAERDAVGVRRDLYRLGFWALAALTLAAVAWGPVRRSLRRVPVWVWLVPGLCLASTIPLIGNPRYRLPLDPFLVLAGAVLLDALSARRGRDEASSISLPVP